MAFKLPIGPPQIVLHQGYSVLVTDLDGQLPSPSKKGLFYLDTRVMSVWRILANGEPWDLLNSASVSHYAARFFLVNRPIATVCGEIPPRTVALSIARWISGGLHEDVDIANHGMALVHFDLEIEIRSDFADIFEVKAGAIVRRGQIATEWTDDPAQLRTIYRNKDFRREFAVLVSMSNSSPVYANGRITFDVKLAPGQRWHACLLYEPGDASTRLRAPPGCFSSNASSNTAEDQREWTTGVLKLETTNTDFRLLFQQAIDDMGALRLPIETPGRLEFVPAGGAPWYMALFGRDSLIASLQNALVYPGFARATLDALAPLQAKERDDFRDAEPGKIIHEMRLGELAHFKKIPHTPYYGTADATILYLIVLHSAWRCTGSEDLLRRHLAAAERCLDWIDKYGDQDGDGFQEYATRSPRGYENQGWKDSAGSVVYPDGSLVEGPKALCELQGYVYDAWLRMAEIFQFIGQNERARALETKARELYRRFNNDFWDEEAGFYAYALDGHKKRVMTVASNIGHCLWSAIVPRERAGRVVARLMASDMRSGWGLRTLSTENPAYNPHSYQNGSVWPHDNGIIAMGFRRYGFTAEALQIAHEVTDAASYFSLHQMPELYAGLERETMSFPIQYLGANVPQAWAAGSTFAFLQAILAFQPDAPRHKLYIDSALPEWLPDLTIRNLSVGDQLFDLRLWRTEDRTRWELMAGDAEWVSQRAPM